MNPSTHLAGDTISTYRHAVIFCATILLHMQSVYNSTTLNISSITFCFQLPYSIHLIFKCQLLCYTHYLPHPLHLHYMLLHIRQHYLNCLNLAAYYHITCNTKKTYALHTHKLWVNQTCVHGTYWRENMKYSGYNHYMNTLVILCFLAILLKTVYSAWTLDVIQKNIRFWLATYLYWAFTGQMFFLSCHQKIISLNLNITLTIYCTHTHTHTQILLQAHKCNTYFSLQCTKSNHTGFLLTRKRKWECWWIVVWQSLCQQTSNSWKKIKMKYHNPRNGEVPNGWPNILMPYAKKYQYISKIS
jgi:hypothetical protein